MTGGQIVAVHLEKAYHHRQQLGPVDAAVRQLARRAAGHLGSSGQRALDRDDARAAVKLLTRAAELLPDDDQERPALTAALGEALYLSAEYQQGAELLTAEIGRHQTTADHRAVMRLRAIRADVADEFWEAIGPAETGGYLYLVAGDPTKAQQILRRAYDALDQIGEKGVMSTQAALLAQAICLAGGPDEEAERFARIGRETAAIEDILSQVPSLGALAKVLARRGELGEAERLARDAVRLAEATDWLSLHGDALVDLATVLGQAGRFDDARPVIRAALGLYHRKGDRASAARARATLAARARGG